MKTKSVLFKGLIANIIFTIILFISAGRLNYVQGWIFFIVNVLSTIVNFLAIRKNIELANERSKLGEGVKLWDKLILGMSAVMYLLMIIVAGFDTGRFLWSSEFNWFVSVLGVLFLIIGQIIFLTARSQNQFFSSVVRIQKERGHVVIKTGLYKIVRHPGYLGMIFSLIGVPLITTSILCIVPTFAAIILLLVRTLLEDKILRTELDGYVEYSKKTKYRLIPLIW